MSPRERLSRTCGILSLCALAAIFVFTGGCDDQAPAPSQFQDIGRNQQVLLPTSSSWHDKSIADGRSEWVAFREPTEAPTDETVAANHAAQNEKLIADVQALLDEYNEIAGDAAADDLLEYFVESQTGSLRPLFESGVEIAEALTAIHKILGEKLPAEQARIDAAMALLNDGEGGKLSASDLTVVSPTEVTAILLDNPAFPTCRFRLIDGDWFIEIDRVEQIAPMVPALQMAKAALVTMGAAIGAGTLDPDAALLQLETMAQAAAASNAAISDDADSAPAAADGNAQDGN